MCGLSVVHRIFTRIDVDESFKSQKCRHKICHESSSYDGVSGTDADEQSLNNSASVFHLWLLEAFS